MSVDYTKTKKRDNIASMPGGAQGVINNENLIPGIVVRGPNVQGDLPGWAGPIVELDTGLLNLSDTKLEAFDVQLNYRLDFTSLGVLEVDTASTWQTHLQNRVVEGAPFIEDVGFSNGPLKFRCNAGVHWEFRQWQMGLESRYYSSYFVYDSTSSASVVASRVSSQGGIRFSDQIYHDFYVSYKFGDASRGRLGWLRGMQVQIGLKNILNSVPPFDVIGPASSGFLYSTYGDVYGRCYSLSVRKRFGK